MNVCFHGMLNTSLAQSGRQLTSQLLGGHLTNLSNCFEATSYPASSHLMLGYVGTSAHLLYFAITLRLHNLHFMELIYHGSTCYKFDRHCFPRYQLLSSWYIIFEILQFQIKENKIEYWLHGGLLAWGLRINIFIWRTKTTIRCS